jgi:NADH-quinone oxidoreductase subunit L
LTFWGDVKIPEEAGHHAHESPRIMTVPLMVLAVGALFLGLAIGTPVFPWIADYLYDNWARLAPAMAQHVEHHVNWPLMIGSSVFALGGIAVAWWMYVKQPALAAKMAKDMPGPYGLSRNRFYIDELYDYFIIKPVTGCAIFCRIIDLYVVDGIVDLLGQVPRILGFLFRPVQNGLVQFYALLMVLGLAGFLLSVLLR